MHNTAKIPSHVEHPPSKECKVPMEVVVEASPASTQDMEIDKRSEETWMDEATYDGY